MSNPYFFQATFTRDYVPVAGEYEGCIFNGCDWAGLDLSGYHFIACRFEGCNWSMAKLQRTVLREVYFKDCKLLGLRFDLCNHLGFSVSFTGCQLQHASFYQLKLKSTPFSHCNLQETDFAETDLTAALFEHCDLALAQFERSNLEKADFRTAFNYTIDPESNRLRHAQFSLPGVVGLLRKYELVVEA